MVQFVMGLPLWQIIRSLGLISYIVLTAGICLGILYSYPIWKGTAKAKVYRWHTYCTVGGTFLGMLHGLITVIDPYVPFAWSGVLIPFTAKAYPVWTGLGTLAGYGMLLLIFTSDIRKKLKKAVWHTIHMFSYPIFFMAFLHGFFEGTDTALPIVQAMYILSVLAVIALTFGRTLIKPAVKRAVH